MRQRPHAPAGRLAAARAPAFVLLSFVALGLTACGAEVERKAPPINPEPREAYRFEVWVEDPPRPMRVESMTAVFQDSQSGCLPYKPVSGALAVSDNSEHPLAFEAVGEGRYRTTIHADLLLQTDLYGKGVCNWQLIGVETVWADSAMRYRQFSAALPVNGETFPVAEYAVFSRDSRGLRDDGAGRAVALPIVSGEGHGPWPVGGYEDLNLRVMNASTGAPVTLGPVRPLGARTDFRVFSLSDRADDS